MISGKLKDVFLVKQIRKALKSEKSDFEGFQEKAGLIIDVENIHEKRKLTEFHKLIGLPEKNFKTVVCGSRGDLNEVSGMILDLKEISLGGYFKSEEIRAFSQENFDFIICHFSDVNPAGLLLAARTQASVKIGNKPDEYGIYDLEIDAGSIDIFQKEALKYLKILKKYN